ncbi:MAG: hypothetical protein JKX97_04625 [Candidatus Lindowbacteria bacterium]|nr:hypothetical protein [Candidatus Lindowbacteria bacterium]
MKQDRENIFYGETEAEAVISMKVSMGHDAIPVKKGWVRRGGILGFGSKDYFQVVGEKIPSWLLEEQVRNVAAKKTKQATGEVPSDLIAKTVLEAARTIRRQRDAERGIRDIRQTPQRSENGWLIDEEIEPPNYLDKETPLAKNTYSGSNMTNTPQTNARLQRAERETSDRSERRVLRRDHQRNSEITRELGVRETSSVSSSSRSQTSPYRDERDMDLIRSELSALRKEVTSYQKIELPTVEEKPLPALFMDFFEILIDKGVEKEISEDIVDKVLERTKEEEFTDFALIRSRFGKEIERRIHVASIGEPSATEPKVIIAAGSTGVGKTTTLAKLGYCLALDEGKDLAFMSLDYFRIGGADQLEQYADIMQVPFGSASNVEDLLDAVDEYYDKDYVIIDTAGRSPYCNKAVKELSQLVNENNLNLELLVVVPAAIQGPEMMRIIETFAILDSAKLVFTKVDETARWGQMFSVASKCSLPIAYLTTGQGVPNDMEPASAKRIADAILDDTDPTGYAAAEAEEENY